MKVWGIRHIRYFYLSWQVHRAAQMWARFGIGLGIPNESDLKHLESIWEGRA